MATQTATFTAAQQGDLRRVIDEFLFRLRQEGNPDTAQAAASIVTDTAGTITFTISAHQANPAFSKAISATVA